MMSDKETDAVTGVDTTGHEWDGIKELNNPLPRWWLWTFYITIAWAIAYMIAFPSLPLVGGAPKGALGYSSREAVAEKIAEAKAAQAGLLAKIEAMTPAEIREDPDAFQFAVAGGRAAFAVNCSQCHGSGAQGGPGYPNLNDDAWLWGGTLEAIEHTIRHGVRYDGDDDTRYSEMPAFGRDGMLTRPQVLATAHYVLMLSGQEHDAALAGDGKTVYDDNCAACHLENGAGDAEQGAPRLNDAVWHYGGELDQIVRQLHAPQHGVMPGWQDRLDAATVKQLAVYVHSLGGGE